MNKSKGFTIIELIVVIAIIAVLAAIVLVNVTGYISKGKDAAIKANLTSLVTNGATYYDQCGSNYLNVNCTAFGSVVFNATAKVNVISNAITAAGSSLVTTENSSLFAACANLQSDSTNAFCVDSGGAKETIAKTSCVESSLTGFACP
ncbi:MAG: prepilin-type N-terminal cleavage/methylation domain-containing protein [Candidatus Staskawiczbacteria bacterium]|nr:prepilin-type N-terminal cleavage/methylation domain-containing protein [Candidatus Staskawiczbacteria bacterium]